MPRIIVTDEGQMISHIKWRHVDGPMLVRANRQLRFLTVRERLLCWLGAMRFIEINPIKTKD